MLKTLAPVVNRCTTQPNRRKNTLADQAEPLCVSRRCIGVNGKLFSIVFVTLCSTCMDDTDTLDAQQIVDCRRIQNIAVENEGIPSCIAEAFLAEMFAIPSQRSFITEETGDIPVSVAEEGALRIEINAKDFAKACVIPLLQQYADGFISYSRRTAYIRRHEGTVAYLTVDPTEKDAFVFPRDIAVRTQVPIGADVARSLT